MDKKIYDKLEQYMLSYMKDSAHDKEHIYRVLYTALDIAKEEKNIDYDVLIASCLFHDIGRIEQDKQPELCHAQIGGERAYEYLIRYGWSEEKAKHVKDCILSHRFRSSNPPKTLEARILFDADKIDATGVIGIARTLIYNGQVLEPLYIRLQKDNTISDGTNDLEPSFFQEYKYKLEGLYDKFYTKRATEIALERQKTAIDFYKNLLVEVRSSYKNGLIEFDKIVNED